MNANTARILSKEERSLDTFAVPPIVRAAQSASVLEAAFAYAELGLSVVPLSGKRPTVPWRDLQHRAASAHTIRYWDFTGLLQNVGVICGTASQNLVVLDLDAPQGYTALISTFPTLRDTYTVATGGGKGGRHLYFSALSVPKTLRVLDTPLGNIELRSNGCQVVAPPSLHPTTHQPYRVECPLPIQVVPDLAELIEWIRTFMPIHTSHGSGQVKPAQARSKQRATRLNMRVVDALSAYFVAVGFKQRGDWLNGQCLCPQHHKRSDAHPSFGFHTRSGYGFCHVCGTFLTKDMCAILGIDPQAFGGLMVSA